MGKVMLEVRNLKTKYVTRFHEDVYAVDGVSFKIEEGKSLGIAGESARKIHAGAFYDGLLFPASALYERRYRHRRQKYLRHEAG